MAIALQDITPYLCCPDDRAGVTVVSDSLRCGLCARVFPVHGGNLVEMLPSQPQEIVDPSVSEQYRAAYRRSWSQTWSEDGGEPPFAAPEKLTLEDSRRRHRQAEEVLKLASLSGGPSEVFCDLSAGAGHITFAAAQRVRLVFHCDLSVAAVRYAGAKAARSGIQNIVVLRADYFRPPFRGSIDRLTCLDSLIRGPWHELRLLATIRGLLAPSGIAVVDFHNWWHNPLRRIGLLRQNFGENRSYSKKEVLRLLEQAGIDNFTLQGFFQEGEARALPMRVLSNFIPPTRFMARFRSLRSGPG